MQPTRAGRAILTVLVVACAAAAVAVIGAPLLIAIAFSTPATPSDALKHGVGEQARTIAYDLRDHEVRSALDSGASRTRIANLTGTAVSTGARLGGIGTDSAGSGTPVLLRAQPVGSSGSAIELAWGGTIGGGTEFGPPLRSWVTCLRIELPATAVDATAWTVEDVDCPTFSAPVRKDAARVHAVDFTAVPLLRPPCFGTTGYCPGG